MVAEITASILQVIHLSRDPKDNLKFECRLIEWTRKKGWAGKDIPMPKTSGVLFSLWLRAKEFNENLARYTEGPDSGTSRSVFHCFCDTLFNIKDKQCGGVPQLVGIYRKPKSAAVAFGIIKNKQRYFLGAPVENDVEYDAIEWRNDLFELCDGQTMNKFEQAQRQSDLLRRN